LLLDFVQETVARLLLLAELGVEIGGAADGAENGENEIEVFG